MGLARRTALVNETDSEEEIRASVLSAVDDSTLRIDLQGSNTGDSFNDRQETVTTSSRAFQSQSFTFRAYPRVKRLSGLRNRFTVLYRSDL